LFTAEDGLEEAVLEILNAKIMDVKDQADQRYVSLLRALEDLQEKNNLY
jgi:hypothetical protein